MFTLLAGKPPFASKSVEEGINNLIRAEVPSVCKVVPGVPREIDDLIGSLMAKNPDERMPTTLALSRTLEELEDALRYQAEAKTAEVSLMTVTDDSFEVVQDVKPSDLTDVAPWKNGRIHRTRS
jgi:serine/threonine protein kinase